MNKYLLVLYYFASEYVKTSVDQLLAFNQLHNFGRTDSTRSWEIILS